MSWRKRAVPINGRRWELARRRAFDRDGWRCRDCSKSGRLQAHHRVPLWRDPEQDAYAEAGLVSLCVKCHVERHRPPPTPWDRFVDELRPR